MTERQLTKEQIRDVQCEVLRQAIHHLPGSCDLHTAMIINKHALTKKPLESQLPTHIANMILSGEYAKSNADHAGPYLVFHDRGKIVDVVEIRALLLNPDANLRHSGLAHLDRQIEVHQRIGRLFLSPQTIDEIEVFRSAVLSDNGRESIDACLKIADLLVEDFFYQVSALLQAAQNRMLGVFENTCQRVLTPSLAMLQFLESMPVHSPCQRADEIESRRRQVLQASSLEELLQEYFRLFGHLPLGGKNSLAGVAGIWLEQHEVPENPWDIVWNWARENTSPLANYHACELFCGHSGLITPEEQSVLLGHIADIILGTRSNSRWKLRCHLARHYCRHIESLRSVTDGEQIAAAAWWLAEYMAPIFESLTEIMADSAKRISTDLVNNSCAAWTLVRPAVTGSPLRYGTLFSESVWSCAILSAISDSKALQKLKSDCPSFETIEQTLDSLAYTSAYFSEGANYAFERSTIDLATHVGKEVGGERQTKLLDFQSLLVELREPTAFEAAIVELPQSDRRNSRIVLHELRSRATAGMAPVDLIYNLLLDDNWRRSMLASGSEDDIRLICDATLEIAAKDGKHDWRVYLPHMIAVACDDSKVDATHKQLFDQLIIASLASNCVSGLQRLLRSNESQRYQDYVTEWRERLDNLSSAVCAWNRGIIRAVRAILYFE